MSSSPFPHPSDAFRSVAAAALALLAGAGFALWLGVSWLQDHLLSPSGFQDTAASVITETSFQDELVRTLLDRATFSALEDKATGIDAVDRTIESIRETVVDSAQSWLTAPEQEGAWLAVLNDTHDANIPLTPSAGHAPDELVVDVSALGEAVNRQVEDAVGFSPGIDEQNFTVTVPGVHTGAVVDALVQLAQWRYVLPWLAGAAGIAAVVVSPRRWLALAGVGVAGVVCTGIVLALALAGGRAVVDAAAVDPVAHLVTEQIVSLLQESFTERGVTGMIWAGVVALAGVIGAVVRVRTVTYDSGHVHRG